MQRSSTMKAEERSRVFDARTHGRGVRMTVRVLLACGGLLLPAATAWAQPQRLDIAERARLRGLLESYRVAGADAARRREIADEILAIGDGKVAAAELLGRITSDLNAPLNRYSADLGRLAQAAVAENLRQVQASHLHRLSRDFRSLQQRGTVDAATIRATAEPAMNELRRAYVADAEKLITGNEVLRRHRQQIMEWAGDWGRCQAMLGEADADFGQWLKLYEYLVVSRAGLPGAASQRLARNEADLLTIDPGEAMAVRDLNIMRVLGGIRPLQVDLRLSEAARGHSQDMREHRFFSHTSPVSGKRTMEERGGRVGVAVHGENIFQGSTDPFVANRWWFRSPGHHINMFRDSFSRIGVGRSGVYWTQNFQR